MKKTKKGFTLVELIAVIGLMPIVFALIYTILKSGSFLYSYGINVDNTETNGRQVMEILSQKVKTSKDLIGTLDIRNGTNRGSQISNSKYARNDLIAYVENYNCNRYIYALKNNNGIEELHQIKLTDQVVNKYTIPADKVIEPLSSADLTIFNSPSGKAPESLSQEVIPISDVNNYINNYDSLGTTYTLLYLMYGNDGSDCYLVATTASSTKIKIKLEKVFNTDLTMQVGGDSVIASFIDPIKSITITNGNQMGIIDINVTDGKITRTITTSVNILNQ